MQEQHTQAMAEKRSRIKDKALRTIFVRFQKEGIHKYPAAVQPISRGLRVNVIVHKGVVSYKDKEGNNIEGWNMYDKQFRHS